MTSRDEGAGGSPKRPPDTGQSPTSKKLRENIKFFEKVWTTGSRAEGGSEGISERDVEEFERRMERERGRTVGRAELEEVKLRKTVSPRSIVRHQEIRDDGTVEANIFNILENYFWCPFLYQSPNNHCSSNICIDRKSTKKYVQHF